MLRGTDPAKCVRGSGGHLSRRPWGRWPDDGGWCPNGTRPPECVFVASSGESLPRGLPRLPVVRGLDRGRTYRPV